MVAVSFLSLFGIHSVRVFHEVCSMKCVGPFPKVTAWAAKSTKIITLHIDVIFQSLTKPSQLLILISR